MFDRFITPIASAYDDAADYSYTDWGRRAWRELGEDSLDRAAGIRLLLNVVEVDAAEPYPTAESMCADIARGRFVVSRANCDHPLWDVDTNVAFQIVHDVLGHYAASIRDGWYLGDGFEARVAMFGHVAGFDWEGENAACASHFRLLRSVRAREALFSECLMQTAWAITNGFDELAQKCVAPDKALRRETGADGTPGSLYDEFRRVVLKGEA